MWQDWALTATQFIFISALIPTILHPTKKPTLATSLTTAPTIFFVAFLYVNLELWLSALGATVLALEWSTLAYQRWRLDSLGIATVQE